MDQEIELKFLIPAEAADPLAARLKAERRAALNATYFDSADGRLRRAGWSLRIRDEDGTLRQTAKGPGEGLIGRAEVEATVTGERPDLDAPALAPLRRALDGAVVEPRFTVRVERRLARIAVDGADIECAVDVGEIEAEGRRAPICELELELKAGPPAALFALARELADAAPLDLAFESKAERGYALLPGAGETLAEPPPRGGTAGQLFQRAARTQLALAQANARLLLEGRRPEALHQTRVALRRLRSLLSAFRPALADERYPAVAADLRALAGELNAARDLDVFAEEVFQPAALAADSAERAGLTGLGTALQAQRAEAYERALAAMGGAQRRRVALETAAWLETGAWTRSDALAEARDRPAEAFAAETLDRLRRKLKREGAGLAGLDPHHRHEARIRAKKLRYAAEAFAPLFPKHAGRRRKFFKALKALQEALGALNDQAVGRTLAERIAADAGPEAAFAAGRLTCERERDEATLLTEAEGAFEALMGVKPFWR
jgi:triphosphatase